MRSTATRALSPLIAFAVIAIQSACSASAKTVQARTSQSVVNSMGVNTHLDQADTIYQTDFSSWLYPALADLGIKHIRDGVSSSWSPTQVANIKTLYANLDVTDLLCLDPVDQWQTGYFYAPTITPWLEAYLPEVDALECSNEPDLYDWEYDNLGGQAGPFYNPTYGSSDSAHALVLEAEQFYSIVKGDSNLNGVKVCTPPFSNPGSYIQDFTPFLTSGVADYGGGHYYQSGNDADYDSWSNVNWAAPNAYIAGTESVTGPSTPIYVGETGYSTDPTYQTGALQGLSERAAGIYLPLVYCEGFRQLPVGSRTYLYEFADSPFDDKYGAFLRSDGSKKPAYYAVKGLVSLLKDPNPSKTFTPGSLGITMSGGPITLHSSLVQNSNGVYFLLMWNDVSVFTPATPAAAGSDVYPPTVPVTVKIATNCNFQVYSPSDASGPFATTAYTVGTTSNSISLNVPAQLLVLQITNGQIPVNHKTAILGSNGSYAVENSNSYIYSYGYAKGTITPSWEFEVQSIGKSGQVALFSQAATTSQGATGAYLQDDASNSAQCVNNYVGPGETMNWIPLGGNRFALQNPATGLYLTVGSDPNSSLVFTSATPQTFTWVDEGALTSINITQPTFANGLSWPNCWGDQFIVSVSQFYGNYVAMVKNTAAEQQTVAGLSPNTTYTLSCWAETPAASGLMYLGASGFDNLGTQSYGAVPLQSYPNYVLNSVAFTTAPSDTGATIYLYNRSGSDNVYGTNFSLSN